MSNLAISCDGLSKQYRIGGSESYRTIRESLSDAVRTPFRIFRRNGNGASDSANDKFWALKDVSFEVKHGEVLGIIGRNGAGKSTLLKILSRITKPTDGGVHLNGRVGSLLEVGTGFHPELTGRENLYLNGAILGMKKSEIARKFDEIVAFAEIEKFIDTPVKRYSSGMYVRLAFAVAAHLDPEILLVDEVLAVGDAQFQKKCLGKMGEVAKLGRTVLLVSHNMVAIENLCPNALLLDTGQLIARGASDSVIAKYLQEPDFDSGQMLSQRTDRKGSGEIRFTSIDLLNGSHQKVKYFQCGDDAILRFNFVNHACTDFRNLELDVGIDSEMGQRVLWLSTRLSKERRELPSGVSDCIDIHIPELPLTPGRYGLTLFSTINGGVSDWIKSAASFDVHPRDFFGTGKLPPKGQGNVMVRHFVSMPGG